jgi:hypothetical protein
MKLEPEQQSQLQSKQDLIALVQKEFVGRMLIPVFPYFLPWAPGEKGTWRKVGNVIEMEKDRFDRKTPVLILDVVDEQELNKIIPLKGYIRELDSGRLIELWIRCLWAENIVYHRVSDQNFYILKQQLMDNF